MGKGKLATSIFTFLSKTLSQNEEDDRKGGFWFGSVSSFLDDGRACNSHSVCWGLEWEGEGGKNYS